MGICVQGRPPKGLEPLVHFLSCSLATWEKLCRHLLGAFQHIEKSGRRLQNWGQGGMGSRLVWFFKSSILIVRHLSHPIFTITQWESITPCTYSWGNQDAGGAPVKLVENSQSSVRAAAFLFTMWIHTCSSANQTLIRSLRPGPHRLVAHLQVI